MQKLKTQPDNWPANAPAYHSPEGWQFEKKMIYEQLKNKLKKVKK